MPFLIWLDTQEAVSSNSNIDSPHRLFTQVSYMLPAEYDWATADWLGPGAGSPTRASSPAGVQLPSRMDGRNEHVQRTQAS